MKCIILTILLTVAACGPTDFIPSDASPGDDVLYMQMRPDVDASDDAAGDALDPDGAIDAADVSAPDVGSDAPVDAAQDGDGFVCVEDYQICTQCINTNDCCCSGLDKCQTINFKYLCAP